jgi:DNA-binding MarR family transcriptional regulator
MPRSRRTEPSAAAALVSVAPLVTRWIERLLAAHEPPLTVPQYLALRAIAREELTASELARRAGVSGPAATQLVNGLAEAGLVQRLPSPGDRRRVSLALSAEGSDAYRSAEAALSRGVDALLGDLPRPEADALARLLGRVEALLSGAPPPRRPPPPPPRRR